MIIVLPTTGEATHWGMTDWRSNMDGHIRRALQQGPDHQWTTDWYACARTGTRGNIVCVDRYIKCTVMVCKGPGSPAHETICYPWSGDIDILKEHMALAWQMAEDKVLK